MSKFSEFIPHLNNCDAKQIGDDPLAVVSMTSEFEPQILNKAIKLMPDGHICEIGSWVGGTDIVIISSMLDKYGDSMNYKLYSIDPLSVTDLAYDGNLTKFINENNLNISQMYDDNIEKWNATKYVIKIRKKSQDVEISEIPNVSLLFVDSSHEEESVLNELIKFSPKVVKNGYIILHDRNLAGVSNAINRFLKDNKSVTDISGEFINDDISRKELAMRMGFCNA